jgi:hypothetical protein
MTAGDVLNEVFQSQVLKTKNLLLKRFCIDCRHYNKRSLSEIPYCTVGTDISTMEDRSKELPKENTCGMWTEQKIFY